MNPMQRDAEKPLELSIIGLLIKDAVESPTPKKQNRKKKAHTLTQMAFRGAGDVRVKMTRDAGGSGSAYPECCV